MKSKRPPIRAEVLNKTQTVIFSASGRDTFSESQQSLLGDVHYVVVDGEATDGQWLEAARPYSVIALTPRVGRISAEMIEQLPRLKALVAYATGTDWVDKEALTHCGIELFFIRDYCSTSVAEHALAMMLTFSRRIHLSQLKSTAAIPKSVSWRGSELAGKTLGVIGLGTIGQKVARFASAFGMDVVYYDPRDRSVQWERLSREELIRRADYIALVCPYRDETEIGAEELRLLKPTAYLINVSRQGLVDNKAVLAAIRQKRLAGYAVDDAVLTDDSSLEPGRLLQTFHTAWYSNEAIERGTAQWVDLILEARQTLG